jgi:hypothetical protein
MEGSALSLTDEDDEAEGEADGDSPCGLLLGVRRGTPGMA